MARGPSLITAYSRSDGRDFTAIQHFARTIREAGLIPTTKRGRGAAPVTEREAVNLLLAANGADSAPDAPRAVRRIRMFRQSGFPEIPGRFERARTLGKGPGPIDTKGALEDFDETQRLLGESIWGPLVKIEQFGEACEWLIRNAISIENHMQNTKLQSLIQLCRDGIWARELAEIVGRGEIPEVFRRQATRWAEGSKTTIKLTLMRDEAIFEAVAPEYDNFIGVRLRYLAEDLEAERRGYLPRRAYVELDFHLFHELALVVAPNPQAR